MDSSSLDEVLCIPNTLMARGRYPHTSLFLGLPVYCCLVYLDDWSENPFLEDFLLHFDKELAGIPSSASSFDLSSYPSRLWETLPIVYTSHITFVLS
jgi:hypothetical protein